VAEIVSGIPEFDIALDHMKAKINAAARKFVLEGAEKIKVEAQKQFSGNSSNTWNSTAWPIPTRRTGNLESSIYMDSAKEISSGVWESTTGPHIVYARRIELGFHGSGQWPYFTTRPFPYMQPGIERAIPKLDYLFTQTVLAAQEA
jgi:hypothetical protein